MKSDFLDFNMTSDPLEVFSRWYLDAKKVEDNCDSFTLSTIGLDGFPNARTLLYKGLIDDSFSFYSNYDSLKSKEITDNPYVSLTFFWQRSGQQVRIRGRVTKMEKGASREYFQSRNYHSQVASYVSKQSSELASRAELEEMYHQTLKKYEDGTLPYPENWGGFLVEPFEMTFFIYGEYRLNDRFNYSKENGEWIIKRLYP